MNKIGKKVFVAVCFLAVGIIIGQIILFDYAGMEFWGNILAAITFFLAGVLFLKSLRHKKDK